MGRVWVVGSINVDTVLRVDHLPGPGETTTGLMTTGLGGKGANQAVAAARAGAEVYFGGAVGEDAAAEGALATLAAEGINLDHVVTVGGPTGSAFVMVDRSGENSIVVVAGANGLIDGATIGPLPYRAGDVVVVQGEVPVAVSHAVIAPARAAGALVVWNPAPADRSVTGVLDAVDVVVVNRGELATLVGDGSVADGVAELHRLGAGAAIATLGPDGVVAWAGGEIVTMPAVPVEVVDTTGAGDCFVGVLSAGLAAGEPLTRAMGRAVAAAAIAVGRPGASAAMPTQDEIDL
jgi:ribokinase